MIDLAFSLNMLDGAASAGYDPAALLSRAGLPQDVADLPPAGLSMADYVRLVRVVTLTMGDEFTGLLDRPQRIGTFALMAAHASHGRSVRQAYERAVGVSNLLDLSLEYAVAQRGRAVVFTIRRRPGRRVLNELAIETPLVLLHRLLSWLSGALLPVDAVWFDFPPPPQAPAYRALFRRAPIRFAAEDSGLSMPAAALDRPILRSEAQAVAWARRTPLDAFLPLEAVDGLALRVANAMLAGLARDGETPTMGEVADAMGMAPHTLRRRLRAEGASYLRIRNQAKRDAAIRLLNTTGLPMEEIAARVGFSEASAFVRAFRGWTGLTPRAYRVGRILPKMDNR